MRFSVRSLLTLPTPSHWYSRYLLVIAIAGTATLLRAAIDPWLGKQVPYFIYVAAVVLSAWFASTDGGIVCVIAAALAGHYFFVEPRYSITFRAEDITSMGFFGAVSTLLVWVVGLWREAETQVRVLHGQTMAVIRQMPVGVIVAEPSGRVLSSNIAAARILNSQDGLPPDIHGLRDALRFQPLDSNGKVMSMDEAPIVRALTGEAVAPQDFRVAFADGTERIVSTSASPIRDEQGRITSAVMALADVTTIRTTEEAMRRRAEELQAILDTVPVGVFITHDCAGQKVSGNRFAHKLLNIPMGANLSLTAPDEERPTAYRVFRNDKEVPGEDLPIQTAARGLEVNADEDEVRFSDGTVKVLLGYARPLRHPDGQVRGAIGAFVDVTERKAMESRLQRQAQEIAEANRMKDEFLSVLSHELRTPLGAIFGWSEMLLTRGLDAAATRKAMEAINRNARAQAALINDVLDVARIVSGKLRLDMRPVDAAATIEAAIDTIAPAASAKGISVIPSIQPQSMLMADPERLQQVVCNLLSNSVKFTPTGGRIFVTVSGTDAHVQISVRDTGMGISADFLPQVFERFSSRDSSTTRVQGGLGLGLSIVRHLTELHGGTIRAESAGKGEGAEFIVTLPVRSVFERQTEIERTAAQAAMNAHPMASSDALRGLRVLVVDDQPDARALLESVLGGVGADVLVCASGREALDAMAREPVDVLIADIGMPEMDGYELIRQVRALPNTARLVPAVALTAFGAVEERDRALNAGFHAHVVKPVSPDQLVAIVASHAQMGRDIGA
jgi:signal transduction histidine kinase/ActR/RegA family two-component response regulator